MSIGLHLLLFLGLALSVVDRSVLAGIQAGGMGYGTCEESRFACAMVQRGEALSGTDATKDPSLPCSLPPPLPGCRLRNADGIPYIWLDAQDPAAWCGFCHETFRREFGGPFRYMTASNPPHEFAEAYERFRPKKLYVARHAPHALEWKRYIEESRLNPSITPESTGSPAPSPPPSGADRAPETDRSGARDRSPAGGASSREDRARGSGPSPR